jgi:hypothetical protein
LQLLQSEGLVLDLNVLRLYPVELDGARIEDGYAEIYLRFDVQEVRVITNKKGELKEGSYEEIMKTNYCMFLSSFKIVIFYLSMHANSKSQYVCCNDLWKITTVIAHFD